MGDQRQGVSGLERLLFGITRAIALFVAILALAGIVICVLFLLGRLDRSTRVSYTDIEAALTTGQATGGQSQQGVLNRPTMQLPENLRQYLTEDDVRSLRRRLPNIERDEQWRDFLENLSTLVGEAESDPRRVSPRNLIDTYVILKNQKLAQSDAEKYVAIAGRYAAVAVVVGLLFLLIQVSLVLVLLAVERHTRAAATVPTSRA